MPGVDERHPVDVFTEVREDFRDQLAALAPRLEPEWRLHQGADLFGKEAGELVEPFEFLTVAPGEFGLEVPGVHVARAAVDEEPDHSLRLRGEMRRARLHGIERPVRGGARLPAAPRRRAGPPSPALRKPIPQRWSIERRDSTGRAWSFLVFMVLTGCTGIRSSSATTGSNRSAPLQHLAGCSLRRGSAGSR